MEMLRYDPTQPTIKHFSHHHTLELHNPQTHPPLTANSPPCACCKSPLSAHWPFYTCSTGCNFLIHARCAQHPGRIAHLGHGSHSLDLLPKPAYPSGQYKCDGCGLLRDGFSFHCSVDACNFDLHVACAAMPARFSHHSHHHELSLLFNPPYYGKAFLCNVCGRTEQNQWVYHCHACNFDSHLGCVAAAPGQPAHLTTSHKHVNHWTYPYVYWPAASAPVMPYNPPAVPATHAGGRFGITLLAAVLNGISQVVFQSFLS